MMLSKINTSTELDEGKTLLLPVSHCVRIPISFGDAVNLMEAVVEEFHSALLSQVFSFNCLEAAYALLSAKVHLDIVLSKSKTY